MAEIHRKKFQPSVRLWLVVFGLVLLVAFGVLGYRLVDLQVFQHDQLSDRARGNTIRTIKREARRGNILDCNGNLLATSLFVKTVCADPSLIGNNRPHVARTLAPLLEMDEAVLRDLLRPQLYLDD